ncbi:MAG: hypothetical protein QM500_07785, partial [Methylococcales bacterium]
MNEALLIIFIIITACLAVALIWLIIENKKLKQQFTTLSKEVERNNKDIAGLCSAAVSVDNRLIDSRDQLKKIVDKVADFKSYEQQADQPYQDAIQRIRKGADVE